MQQPLMSLKPSPTTYLYASPAAQNPLQAIVIPAHRPVLYSNNKPHPHQTRHPTRDHDALAQAALVRPSAPRATNHLPPGERWARRLPACS